MSRLPFRSSLLCFAVLSLLWFGVQVSAQDSSEVVPQDDIFPRVVQPTPEVKPTPPPKPLVWTQINPTLSVDRIYVAKSAVPFLLIVSPPDSVNIQEAVGPLTIYGKFADNPDATIPELRTITDPHIRVITPKLGLSPIPATIELIGIPQGITTLDQIQRITLNLGPIPPPTPPGPTPLPPEPTPTVKEFRVIFAYDMAKGYSAPLQQVLNSNEIRTYLSSVVSKSEDTPDWRFWDIKAPLASTAPRSLATLWQSVADQLPTLTSPHMIIRHNGKTEIVAVPPSVSATLSLLKQYEGK